MVVWARHSDRSGERTWHVVGACLLASLLNPNGWQLHAQILGFLRSPVVATYANEFRSPNFHSTAMRGFLGLLHLEITRERIERLIAFARA